MFLDLRFLSRDFNPRSLTGATKHVNKINNLLDISIHAPSRERLYLQSLMYIEYLNFNPRSLTGATEEWESLQDGLQISIHAPSRERHTAK